MKCTYMTSKAVLQVSGPCSSCDPQVAQMKLGVVQGASRTAPEACQVKQDATALAAAEQMLAGNGNTASLDERARKDTIITCRRMLLDLASLKVFCLTHQMMRAKSQSLVRSCLHQPASYLIPACRGQVSRANVPGITCNKFAYSIIFKR